MPDFQKFYEANKDRVYLIGIAVDSKGDPKKFVEKRKYGWIFGYDIDGSKKFGIKGIPVTLFFDAEGKLIGREEGSITLKDLEKHLTLSK